MPVKMNNPAAKDRVKRMPEAIQHDRDQLEKAHCPAHATQAARDALWASLTALCGTAPSETRTLTYKRLCAPVAAMPESGAGQASVDWSKWWREPTDEKTEVAPYMATVQASRVSHSPPGAALFDSEVQHQHYIVLRINSADRKRDLSRDWVHANKELVEVAMTEAQWATFISTLNHGSGTPATVKHILHQKPPVEPTLPEDRTALFDAEMKKTNADLLARLEALEAGKLTKAQKHEIGVIRSHLKSNSRFVETQFREHMEDKKARLKGDVEAYMNATIGRAGARALGLPEPEHRDDKAALEKDETADRSAQTYKDRSHDDTSF